MRAKIPNVRARDIHATTKRTPKPPQHTRNIRDPPGDELEQENKLVHTAPYRFDTELQQERVHGHSDAETLQKPLERASKKTNATNTRQDGKGTQQAQKQQKKNQVITTPTPNDQKTKFWLKISFLIQLKSKNAPPPPPKKNVTKNLVQSLHFCSPQIFFFSQQGQTIAVILLKQAQNVGNRSV